MNFKLALALLAIGVVLLVAYIVILISSNSKVDVENKNHFRNSFPFQYYMSASISTRAILYSLIVVSLISMSMGLCFFFSGMEYTFYQLFLAILFPVSGMMLLISNILSLSFYKAHIATSMISFVTFGLACTSMALIPFIPGLAIETHFYSTVICVIIGIIGIFSLLSLVNPKLSNWSKMDKVEKNGTTYYVKPKINFYTLNEWITLFLYGVVSVLIFINILVTKVVSM